MKAKDVPVDEWFMVKKTKRWFKKCEDKGDKTVCSQIGPKTKVFIDNEEEVQLRKGK
jgi:hypothetical protein